MPRPPRPTSIRIKTGVLIFLRLSLGGAFAFSGFTKLIEPYQNFLYVVEGFEILPRGAQILVAHTLPWVEFLGGIFLVLGLWTGPALGILWLLNTLFIGVLAQALYRKLPIEECGCFGDLVRLPLPVMLGVDLTLWAVFLYAFLCRNELKRIGLDGRFGER